MTILGIDHVQLAIPPGDEAAARARRFYGEVLGLVEIEKPAPMRVRGGMWFSAGAVAIHLGVEPDMRASKKAHPALVVDDLAPYRARAVAAGATWRDDRELPEVVRAHLEDPFGNRIELVEAAP